MANWDSADLLARSKRLAKRPTTDAQVDDTDWYAWLTEAEAFVVQRIATHVPDVLYTAPTKLTTSDSGITYDFPSSIYPLGNVELRRSPTGGLMIPGAVDGSTDSIVQPPHVRILLVFKAVETWARTGGNRDPGPFEQMYVKAWSGDPADPSDVGILGAFKNQFLFSGAASFPAETPWTQTIDDGSGYTTQL